MGSSFEYPTPIRYNSDYRKVELECKEFNYSDDEIEYENQMKFRDYVDLDCDTSESSIDMESDEETDQIVCNDKYLIFTTGFKTYTPHQIGKVKDEHPYYSNNFYISTLAFKRIKPVKFPKRIDPGLPLKERLLLHEKKKEERKDNIAFEPNWLDYDSVADKFDKIDHLIDLHGHIIGMGLSPDHR